MRSVRLDALDSSLDCYASLYNTAKNGSVSIYVQNPGWVGSGFVYLRSGTYYIVTAAHVILNSTRQDPVLGPIYVALPTAEGVQAVECTVVGVAGDAAFEQITYMSPENITSMVFGSLGLMDNPERGILVVGLDLPNLAPAVGAGASIDKASDNSFVFAGIQAVFATEIPSNGQGFLTFPNVEPGEVNVTVSYPQGSCRIFPAETEAVPVTVTAGEVTVVAYTCRPE